MLDYTNEETLAMIALETRHQSLINQAARDFVEIADRYNLSFREFEQAMELTKSFSSVVVRRPLDYSGKRE